MPLNIEHEGQHITVYTAEEIAAAESTARDAERTRIEADPNGLAAKARKQAEATLKTTQAEVTRLTEELAKTGQTTEQITALQAQLATAAQEKAAAETAKAATEAQFAYRTKLMTEHGIPPALVADAEALLTLRGITPTAEADALKTAADAVKGILKLDATGTPTPPVIPPVIAPPGVGGSPTPGATGKLTAEEAGKLSPEDYAEKRKAGLIQ